MSNKIENYDSWCSKMYNDEYMDMHVSEQFKWEIPFSEKMVEFFNITSMIDFGCGVGNYLLGAHNKNLTDLRGYEFSYCSAIKYADNKIKHLIEKKDVGSLINVDKTFDTAISIEVAEHLPHENSENLVKNLVNFSERLIIFTAAPPNQGGHGHINEQPYEFWIELFNKYNYNQNQDITLAFKDSLSYFYYPWWIKNNLMVFEKNE